MKTLIHSPSAPADLFTPDMRCISLEFKKIQALACPDPMQKFLQIAFGSSNQRSHTWFSFRL